MNKDKYGEVINGIDTYITNCKNCGAVLKDMKCAYCGSEYEYIPEFNDFKQIFKVKVGGTIRKFYVNSVQIEPCIDTYRTIYGKSISYKFANDNIRLELISYD